MKTGAIKNAMQLIGSVFFVFILVSCGGSGGSGSSTSTGSSGATLTLTGFAAVSTIPGLTYSSIISNSGTYTGNPSLLVYSRVWTTSNNTSLASLNYQVTSNEELLNFDVTADASAVSSAQVWYYAALSPLSGAGFCHVSGTNASSLPLCSALNISVDRAAGTITFASSPAVSYISSSSVSSTGTLSGTLTFPAF